MEDRKNSTLEILSAKDLQDMGFSRSMAYALFNRVDVPVIRIGKRKFIRREKFLEWIVEQEKANKEESDRRFS
ncbi:MAG TPA: DNA-binding protein [Ruminococcus sp.]|nr:DNA-binding protein [Ruminococcus sp.]